MEKDRHLPCDYNFISVGNIPGQIVQYFIAVQLKTKRSIFEKTNRLVLSSICLLKIAIMKLMRMKLFN